MIEAWQIEHRPWLYFFLRRLELTRWTLRGKVLHEEAKWYARLLALYLALTGYETERCCFCGWKVGCVWWCDDQDVWATVTGWQDGDGVACLQCFNDRAESRSIYLRFVAEPLRKRAPKEDESGGYTEAEWREMITKDEERLKAHLAR